MDNKWCRMYCSVCGTKRFHELMEIKEIEDFEKHEKIIYFSPKTFAKCTICGHLREVESIVVDTLTGEIKEVNYY